MFFLKHLEIKIKNILSLAPERYHPLKRKVSYYNFPQVTHNKIVDL